MSELAVIGVVAWFRPLVLAWRGPGVGMGACSLVEYGGVALA